LAPECTGTVSIAKDRLTAMANGLRVELTVSAFSSGRDLRLDDFPFHHARAVGHCG